MKNRTALIHENIDNLTSLWRTAGEKANAHTSGADFDFGEIRYSEWPNRLWFHHDIKKDNLKSAKNQLLSASTRLVIAYWDIYQSHSYELLEANGFEKIFEQVGMSLKLTQPYDKGNAVRMKRVSGEGDSLLWEALFQQAFGYKISHKLLLADYEDTSFLLAYHKTEPVGTAILHNSGAVAGIHGMGVIPEMRRKGFAEQMMINILHQSVEQGFKYAVLQASSMGKGLYLKLGFEELFIMKNYALVR